jgi:hypothetical protein
MKRVLAVLLTCLMAVSLSVAVPGTAEAKKKKRDTPGCVSKVEYRAIRPGMTGAQVASLVDTWGSQRFYNDHGYWGGDWVESGYWVNDGYWESQYDDFGTYTGEVWVDMSYWEDTSYWDEMAQWESMLDTVRTYKKCRSFNRGRGRVAINFDNYSRPWLSGARVAYKDPSNAAFMDIAAYFRLGARNNGKDVPGPRTKAETPKPRPVPTSPRPAPQPNSPMPTKAHG